MDAATLRAQQAPLKQGYRDDPATAQIHAHAEARLSNDAIACTVPTWHGETIAGLHPAAGGDGSEACSADLLLQALVACAGVTLKAVTTAMGVEMRSARVVADGIWELQTRPFRGDHPDVHTVRIAQVTGTQSGAHTFAFSDPHYLATSAGREYHIHLDRSKPVPDLLTLDSTSSADPRYQQIVDTVEAYGSPRFRETIAKARAKLLRS